MQRMLAAMCSLVLYVFLAWTPARAAAAEVTPDAFTRQAAEALRAKAQGLKVKVIAPLELRATPDGDDDGQTIFLDNAYRLYLGADAADRDALLDRYVTSFVEPLSEAPPKREELVAVIKGNDWLAAMEQVAKQQKRPYEGVYERLNDDLLVFYAQDTPTRIRYLSLSDLKAVELDRAELRELAVGNLQRQLTEIGVHRGELISMVVADGSYEASMLLFDDFWQEERSRMKGPPVASVPARNLLMFADSSNPEAVAQLRELTRKMWGEAAYGVSDAIFISTPQGWRPLAR